MTLEIDLVNLAQAVGAETKAINLKTGLLSNLSTTTKANLVAALNEIHAIASAAGGGGGAAINDGTTTSANTWSAAKITTAIAAAAAATKSDLVNGASAALDTFAEFAAAINNDPTFAATLATSMSKRVRFDAAQVLTGPEQVQARTNIAGAGAAEFGAVKTRLDTLEANLGAFGRSYADVYNAAKV